MLSSSLFINLSLHPQHTIIRNLPVEETWHHVLHGVSDGFPLGICSRCQVLLHLAHLIDALTIQLQALVHKCDVERVLYACVCVCVCVWSGYITHGHTYPAQLLLILGNSANVSG